MSDKKEEEGRKPRTYLKLKAWFKCSKPECGRDWTSVHAWKRDENIICEKCEGKADVEKFLDEECELDNYYCDNCDNKHWQKIHTGRVDKCSTCENEVQPNGTQKRHGRHFWYVCLQEECKHAWEGYTEQSQRTQRCVKCNSRGDVHKTAKVPFRYHRRRRPNPDNPESPGAPSVALEQGDRPHNWQYCDMCSDLKGQGKAETCLPFRKVQCQVVKLDEGLFTERITKCT